MLEKLYNDNHYSLFAWGDNLVVAYQDRKYTLHMLSHTPCVYVSGDNGFYTILHRVTDLEIAKYNLRNNELIQTELGALTPGQFCVCLINLIEQGHI